MLLAALFCGLHVCVDAANPHPEPVRVAAE
jgi:hypothetical protein